MKRGRKKTYQLRPHLSQMRTTKYMPFTQKKRLFDKNVSQWGGGRPPPLESATDLQHGGVYKMTSLSPHVYRFYVAYLKKTTVTTRILIAHAIDERKMFFLLKVSQCGSIVCHRPWHT